MYTGNLNSGFYMKNGICGIFLVANILGWRLFITKIQIFRKKTTLIRPMICLKFSVIFSHLNFNVGSCISILHMY